MQHDWRDSDRLLARRYLKSDQGMINVNYETDGRKPPVRHGATFCIDFEMGLTCVEDQHRINLRQILTDLTGIDGASNIKGHWRWTWDNSWGVYGQEAWISRFDLIYPLTTEQHYKHPSGEPNRCIFKIGKLSAIGIDAPVKGPIQHGVGTDYRFVLPYDERYLDCHDYIRLQTELEDDLESSCSNPWIFGYDDNICSYELRFSSADELTFFNLRWA